MTKLKNTKKGMAKKALSISLVAAMLATSNVPVWTAEVQTAKEVINTQKKYKVNDVTDEIPDSAAASGSVLF